MFQIGKTIVSEELLQEEFSCNLSACKGACCVEGEAGAPLDENEIEVLQTIYSLVKPYLRKEGIDAIAEQGVYIRRENGDLETPLIAGKECAFVVFDDKGTALCGIENAFYDGKIDWKKPISCHLYPVRLQKYSTFTAVNYHRWDICSEACSLGKALKIPVYKFTREALIRKFGQTWYDELEEVSTKFRKEIYFPTKD